MRRPTAGVTLIEVLIAVTLLSMLSVAMLFAMRTGLNTYVKAGDKLMENRRVAGAQRIISEQIEGLIPVSAPCIGTATAAPGNFVFFQGDSATMRFISAYSLQEAWRGQPRILEYAVVPGEEGRGVRLVVNETPYAGPIEAGRLCIGITPDPQTMAPRPRFGPVTAGPNSFVLADGLEYCRISYFAPVGPPAPMVSWNWSPEWSASGWPRAIRIEMAPLQPDPSRVQPITVVAPVRLRRAPELIYAD